MNDLLVCQSVALRGWFLKLMRCAPNAARQPSNCWSTGVVGGAEFEECAKLDEALDKAHRLLKENLRTIMLSRISRRSRPRSSKK